MKIKRHTSQRRAKKKKRVKDQTGRRLLLKRTRALKTPVVEEDAVVEVKVVKEEVMDVESVRMIDHKQQKKATRPIQVVNVILNKKTKVAVVVVVESVTTIALNVNRTRTPGFTNTITWRGYNMKKSSSPRTLSFLTCQARRKVEAAAIALVPRMGCHFLSCLSYT